MPRNIELVSENVNDHGYKSDAESENGWVEQPDSEGVMVQDLFRPDSISFSSVEELVEHTKTAQDIDLVKIRKDLSR